MSKKLLFFALFLFVKNANAQYIKIDNGAVLSYFHNKKNLDILSSRTVNYSILAGADYLDKKWFSLSSQIGYIRIGGKDENENLPSEYRNIIEEKSYLHLNTTFRAYKEYNKKGRSKDRTFIGIGPYLNTGLGSENFKSALYRTTGGYKKVHAGGKLEIGATKYIDKLNVGLVGNYMLSMSPPASIKANNNAFSIMLSVGYLIK